MKLNLKVPLCLFDLETTGTSPTADRIIEIAIIKLTPGGETVRKRQLINPTISIPEQSTAIHGIRNEDVATQPTFKEVAKEFARFLEGCDLGGYNILKFDLPLLVEEFLRAEVEFDYSRKRIVDAQRIFHLMEKRTLQAAYGFYCGKQMENAHSAESDTEATLEVLLAQVERYNHQDVTDALGKKIGVIENDVDSLARLSTLDTVDLAGRMVRQANGEVTFNFGKHKGKSVLRVLQDEPSYYDWMMNGEFALDTKRKLTELRLSAKGLRVK